MAANHPGVTHPPVTMRATSGASPGTAYRIAPVNGRTSEKPAVAGGVVVAAGMKVEAEDGAVEGGGGGEVRDFEHYQRQAVH